jgi:hypothetical protein
VVPRSRAPWQRDVVESLDAATKEAQFGNITGAEVAVDRAASLIEVARIEAAKPEADFFEMAIAGLDGVLRRNPGNSRLTEHVTLARIELAQLRSFLSGSPDSGTSAAGPVAGNDAAVAAGAGSAVPERAATLQSSDAGADESHVVFGAPRSILGDRVFDPSVAGGNWIDAKLMAETTEVLWPPASRLLVDNVRVANLTIEGAAQTLDGIRWKNVTFIGTRVRYEGGEVDLHNVHFVRCTFGIATNEKGARLANAISLGQASIVIN